MLNPIEVYEAAGRQAAEARNQHDEGRAQFHARWFREARNLEQGEDRTAANAAYDKGYKEARTIPPFTPFR